MNRLLGLAPAIALLLGIAACDDPAPTAPGAAVDAETETAESVLRNRTLTQVDRMGFPAINTAVVIDDPTQDVYNARAPQDDAALIPFAASQLETFYGVPSAGGVSTAVASAFLPDILPLTGHPVFPGREPSDDVIDQLLGALFGPGGFSSLAPNAGLASDNVGPGDRDFPDEFPYFGAPHGG